jgi:hypothetical protein
VAEATANFFESLLEVRIFEDRRDRSGGPAIRPATGIRGRKLGEVGLVGIEDKVFRNLESSPFGLEPAVKEVGVRPIEGDPPSLEPA